MRLLSRLRLKKLNSMGVGHHALIAILVITTIAGFGAYRVWSSSAATLTGDLAKYQIRVASTDGCWLAGRVYDAAKQQCTTTCRPNAGVYKTIQGKDGASRGYCSLAVATSMDTLEEAKYCVQTLHRMYLLEVGCARRVDQENANGARQCIGFWDTASPYKNYVAEGTTDRCVAPTIAQTGDNTGAATATTATNKLDSATCNAMGRKVKDATNCYQDCRADTGTLLVHANGSKYCSKSVATTITEVRCAELHRRWTPSGCARRPDQTGPDGNYAIACITGYPWYNVNSAVTTSGLDVCEKDAATAAANEKAGIIGTKTDGTVVCGPNTTLSTDKKSCIASSVAAGSGSTTVSGSGISGSGTGSGSSGSVSVASGLPTEGKYRIVLYKEKNFKGSKLSVVATLKDSKVTYKVSADDKELSPQPSDLSSLPKGWENQVSSYKIVEGRWQLCPEKSYKAKTGRNPLACVRPWASDPDMNDASSKTKKLDNQVSSIRPLVTVQYEDPEQITESGNGQVAQDSEGEVIPKCTNAAGVAVAVGEDGKCPTDSKLTCPAGLELKDEECKEKVLAANVIVPVDTTFKGKVGEEHCELLGREWIGKPSGGKTTNGGQYGCSLVTCNRVADGAPRQAKDGPVCVNYEYDAPYAILLSKKKCSDLHRVYIEQVKRCAQVPNRKDKNQTIVNARQCRDNGHTVYYIFKENGKDDECFNPNYFQRARSVAKSTGGSIAKALKQGPRAYCATVKRGNYHWNGKRCVIDRKTCWNGENIAVTKSCPLEPVSGGRGATGEGPSSIPPAITVPSICARDPQRSECLSARERCEQEGGRYVLTTNPPTCQMSLERSPVTTKNVSCDEFNKVSPTDYKCIPRVISICGTKYHKGEVSYQSGSTRYVARVCVPN